MTKVIVVQNHQSHSHTHRTEVTEHRAPTDESVRLLQEMQEKAEAHRIETLHLTGNSFSAQIEIVQDVVMTGARARAVYDLNGQRITTEVSVDWRDRDDKFALLEKLRDATAADITREILLASWPKGL